MSKIKELESLCYENNPDIVIVTETWCNTNVSDALLNIPGYYIGIRCDRVDTANGIGGGILVLVKNNLQIAQVDNISDFNQYCHFKLLAENNCDDIDFIAIYRSPNSNEVNNNKLCQLIDNLDTGKVVICGDLNYRNICWETSSADSKGRPFLEAVENKFLEQLIDFPTHNKGGILDILLTNYPEYVLSIDDIGPLGNSDHTAIQVGLQFNAKYNNTDEKVMDWNNANLEGLKEYINGIEWNNILSDCDTEEMWNIFTTRISDGLTEFVPTKDRRDQRKPIWMTKYLWKLTKRKNKAWKSYRDATDDSKVWLHARYIKLRNKCKKLVCKAKRNLEKKLSKDYNKRPFQAYTKSKMKHKAKVGPLKHNGKLISDNKEIATILNDYFSSVFINEDTGHIPRASAAECEDSVSNLVVNETDIAKKIDKLKESSAPGADKITVKILKMFKDELVVPLAQIFNSSISSSMVPRDWRDANVTPIFKKGKRTAAKNYRPVSLTSIPCKILESLLKDVIVDHLVTRSLIKNTQHGFMNKRSCLTNLLEFLEYLTDEMDNGFSTDLVYLDFSKAFDTVPKQRLLEKMKAHKIEGNVLKWIEMWLTNRRQRVVLNGQESAWASVKSGVPQ